MGDRPKHPSAAPARPTRPPAPRRGGRGHRDVPVLTPHERIAVGELTAAWLVAVALFFGWWFSSATLALDAGVVVSTVVLALYVALLPAFFFVQVNRARRPAPGQQPPGDLRVAMVVTKAPSEPWSMVRDTLTAMLDQDVDRPYDVWLADERPDAETYAWCERRGVSVSTRSHSRRRYHRATWPRRRRCKEGNLAWFYDTVGYRAYDLVSQLDADHVPERSYLRHVIAPFADPRVGYVAAPSICDLNADRSWAARGRLHDEAVFHGVMQAGANGGLAPSCIGSHYAVRTQAIRTTGGIGPELAEDFSTTLLLSAAGWEGAFAIDAIAHGRGPDTVADCVTQDLQWSRSMVTLLLTEAATALPRVRPAARARLAFSLAWYPLISTLFVVTHLMPLWALVAGGPLARVGLAGFVGHLLAAELAVVVVLVVLRRSGSMRPHDAPIVSWEMILFRLVRWPWMVLGGLTAVWVVSTGRTVDWKVTPKGADALGRPLALRVLAFPLATVALFALPVVLVPDPAAAGGYFLWAVVGAAAYAAIVAAIVLLHRRENPRAPAPRLVRASLLGRRPRITAGPVAAATVGLVLVLVLLQGPTSVRSAGVDWLSGRPAGPGFTAGTVEPGSPLLGVAAGGLSQNEGRPYSRSMLGDARAFEGAAGVRPGVVLWFSDWTQPPPRTTRLDAVAAAGAVPEITWEPRDHRRGPDQRRFRLERIAAGDFDAYATAWARRLAVHRGPVLLRFAHEMNHRAYPWGLGQGNTPEEYVAAWRHLHELFAREGATNVRWVWSATASRLDWRYWPGDDAVDVVGLTGFNGGSVLNWAGWRTPETLFGAALRSIAARVPGKPVEISEVSTVGRGGDRPRWIRDLFRLARTHPQLRRIVWFNVTKQAAWRIEPGTRDARALRDGLRVWEAPRAPLRRAPRGAARTVQPPAAVRLVAPAPGQRPDEAMIRR